MKTTLFSLLVLLTLTLSAQAQRFVSGLSCTISFAGPVGPAQTTFHKRNFLDVVANTGGRSLDPKSLELVYDTVSKQFQVIQKSDGALVVVVYYVVDEKAFGTGDGSVVGALVQAIRQADLVEPGTPGIVGSIGGPVGEYSGLDGGQTFYNWPARFSVLSKTGGAFMLPAITSQVGIPASKYVAMPSLIQGQFTVHGTPFVPGAK